MDKKSKSDRISELLPKILDQQNDQRLPAVIAAIGQEDQRLADLIAQVREQFFVKTASRPYLDRLAANCDIARPRFIGMRDTEFRNYVPILSYQPKQVKKTVEKLLDLFFLKEATTAFLSSGEYQPFSLKDGWSLDIRVDGEYLETVSFTTADFTNISAVSADELAAAYNRQAKYSYAISFFDSINKNTYIRIFTNTIGGDGSLEIVGGLANIGLKLNGFLTNAGNGANTQWTVTKIGDEVTFAHTGGASPGLDKIEVGDLFLCDFPQPFNTGTFPITSIDAATNSFKFTNLFGFVGIFTQMSSAQTKFLRPEKLVPYRSARRALVWETQPGKVVVEIPATASIVQRDLRSGFFLNGSSSTISSVIDSTSLTVVDAADFPSAGQFVIEPVNAVTARISTEEIERTTSKGRLVSDFIRYSYSGISGNTLTGIVPNLPTVSYLNEVMISGMVRSAGVVTCTTSNDFKAGESVVIRGSDGILVTSTTGSITANSPIINSISSLAGVAPGQLVCTVGGIPEGAIVVSVDKDNSSVMLDRNCSSTVLGTAISFRENTNGVFTIVSADATSFTFDLLGKAGTITTPGVACVERLEFAENSKIIVTSSRPAEQTGMTGSYVWDPNAPFVLSSHTATISNSITVGTTVKLLTVSDNTIPSAEGAVVFDYGLPTQEGPVRYLYKAADNIIVLDPSYIFQHDHSVGCSVTAISHYGGHSMSGTGSEYAPYLTDPAAARVILQEIIESVTSAGVFVDFLVRYPTQLYGTISVYD